jgi:flagellar biosynthesis/type III secretory pathway protein FliH
LSSDAATVGSYTFRQLEAPVGAMTHGAADVLSAAIAQADQIREEARAAGEAEGRAAAMSAVRAEAEPSLQALAGARNALDELRDGLIADLEADAVTLALRLAEQIVAGALKVAPERLIDVAGQAMRRIADRRHVTLVVNPADLELMQESVLRLQSELGGIEHCNVQADRRVGRGGVIARTEAGEIDATIDAQLSRAAEIVAAELSPEDA